MSRELFSASQKRRLGDESYGLEPSASRPKLGSPEPISSNLEITSEPEYEFDESDESDNEYEEVELEEESDYEDGDDYLLKNGKMEECRKTVYENGWISDKPEKIPKQVEYKGNFGPKNKYNTEDESFLSLITPEMIQTVVDCTNDFFKRLVKKFRNLRKEIPRDLHNTDSVEIKALLGLWLCLGITGFHNSSVNEIFSASKYSSLDAHLCFSQKRYKLLMRAIRFDIKSKRGDLENLNYKHIHIKKIHDEFTKNCQALYTPSEHIVVDEILVPFRGRCSFRMYIPSKKAKFGIKIYCLVDPRTMYQINSKIYTGKDKNEKDHGLTVAYQLSEKQLGVGRTMVTDNFYTSPKLGKLLWDCQTYLLGTIKADRTGNPKDFASKNSEKVKEGHAKCVYREQKTILKFQAKKFKQVLLYSTKHHDPELNKNGKPRMVTDYNSTKFAVDIFDEMVGRHAYAPPTRRWPLRLFMHMVDTAALNAYVLFNRNLSRREFIGNLADQLMQEQKDRRRQNKNYWMNDLFIQIDDIYTDVRQKVPKRRSAEVQEPHAYEHFEVRQFTPKASTSKQIPKSTRELSTSHKTVASPCPPKTSIGFENTALASSPPQAVPKQSKTSVGFENTALAYPKRAAPAPPKANPETKGPKSMPSIKQPATTSESKYVRCTLCGKSGTAGYYPYCQQCHPPMPYCKPHFNNHDCI